MASGRLDLPEHFEAGLTPHRITEKYYWARGPHVVIKVVDISSVIETKIEAIRANKTQILNMVLGLPDTLGKQKLTLPWLNTDNETMVNEFVDLVFRPANQHTGQQYGLDYAEAFHYIGPGVQPASYTAQHMEQYLAENAVSLE